MRRPSHISADMTVRQVVAAWPACAAVLEACAGARQDGRWTLQEVGPLGRSCGMAEGELLARLAAAAGVGVGAAGESGRRSASPVAILFAALAVGITLGAGWGVVLLLRIAAGADYGVVSAASVHVHGVAQLWGWMALFIFAVGAHLLRQTTTRPAPAWLERAGAGLVVAGLLAFFVGLSVRVRAAVPAVDVVASGLLAAGAVPFGVAVLWSLGGAAKTQRRYGPAIVVAWMWVWAATDLWLRVRYFGRPVLPESARAALIVLPVLGLGTNAIYVFGIRLIPGLLNIGRLRDAWFAPALLAHNVGLCLFLLPNRIAAGVGAVLMLCGTVAYLVGMDGLRGKESRQIYGVDVRGNVLIRVAFFWLVCGLAMIVVQQFYPGLPHAYGGPGDMR